MTTEIELNESWLHGKYPCGEIDTAYGTVAVNAKYASNGHDWFFQGEDASIAIAEIHEIWINGDDDLTEEEAFLKWINIYL